MRNLLRSTLSASLGAAPVEDRLAAAWPLVCGKAMAMHGSVVGYEGEVVSIAVSSEAWLRQMMSMQRQIAKELGYIAGAKVSTIDFRIGHL